MPSKPRKWKFRLRHMAEAARRIAQYTQGMTFQQFCGDQKTIDAVVRNFMIIGEAVRHVPPDVESRYPEVPWAEMRAMRNVLAHEYDRVDLPVVWTTIEKDIPPLVPLLEKVLGEVGQ